MTKKKSWCRRCGREIDEVVFRTQGIAYDKCRGKKCPDCGKIRKLGEVKGKSLFSAVQTCPRCKNLVSSVRNELCPKCFLEVQAEDNSCVCIFQNATENGIYCSLCKEVHEWSPCCGECIGEKQFFVGRKMLPLWKVIVPSVIGGVVIGIVVGFVFGRIWNSIFNKSPIKAKSAT